MGCFHGLIGRLNHDKPDATAGQEGVKKTMLAFAGIGNAPQKSVCRIVGKGTSFP
jgi:hypothetical protein